MRLEPDRTAPRSINAADHTPPPFRLAVNRGIRNRCPFCGEGKVFSGYLRVVPQCGHCHAPLGRLRADDAPPYFTIFIAGHLLVPLALWVERGYQPPMWLHMALWLPLFTIACILLLRPVKGAVVGWMTSLGMASEDADRLHRAAPAPAISLLTGRRPGSDA
jgi:uncharacterized protein (DUF983 family)